MGEINYQMRVREIIRQAHSFDFGPRWAKKQIKILQEEWVAQNTDEIALVVIKNLYRGAVIVRDITDVIGLNEIVRAVRVSKPVWSVLLPAFRDYRIRFVPDGGIPRWESTVNNIKPNERVILKITS